MNVCMGHSRFLDLPYPQGEFKFVCQWTCPLSRALQRPPPGLQHFSYKLQPPPPLFPPEERDDVYAPYNRWCRLFLSIALINTFPHTNLGYSSASMGCPGKVQFSQNLLISHDKIMYICHFMSKFYFQQT